MPYKEARTFKSRTNYSTLFDDRSTVMFVTGVTVNYPTTLQRFYNDGSEFSTVNQDLYAGEFTVTGGISKNAVGGLLGIHDNRYHEDAFDEVIRHDQDRLAPINNFYASGSILDYEQSTRSKDQIRISIPVKYLTQLFSLTSSIYYLNTVS